MQNVCGCSFLYISELTCLLRGVGLLPRVPGHLSGLRVVQRRLPRGSLPTKEGRQGTVRNKNIVFKFDVVLAIMRKIFMQN
jgi:hypothetical protein